ncbi:MAG: hypothetical protein ACWGNI_00335 [Desulfobacterales bacterium]
MVDWTGKFRKNKYEFYYHRPVAFAEQQILGLTKEEVRANKIGRRLEPQTKYILKAVMENNYVSIAAGRGVTKTTSLALLTPWWLWTRNDARVIATGPKYDNLKATLWAEIKKWLDISKITDEIKMNGEKIYRVDPEAHSFGQIMTTKDKENISGIHATHVLWLIDEVSNVEREIINAILGGMTDPDSKIVMAGNMTKASGPFYDSHYKERKNWFTIRLSSEDSERKNKVWFDKMQHFPRESDMYRVNVLGLPPLGNPMAIIPLSDCFAARDREITAGDYLEMAVDPAREGSDLATISIRQGMKQLEIRKFPKTKGPQLIGHILKMLREYRVKTGIQNKCRIKVDDHGIGGPIGDELALNETDNIEVIPCLFNLKIESDRYNDSATDMWFSMADIIDKVELVDDEDMLEELSTREWRPIPGGKMKVEPKDEHKTRIGRSCDCADVTVMLYYKGSKKVFERPDDKSVSNNFAIDWNYDHLTDPAFEGIFLIDVLHYCALVLNKNLSVTGIAAIYQQYIDKLWIYAEFNQEHPDPDIIANTVKRITHKGYYGDDREVKFIGNKDMFSTNEDRQPISEILMRSGLYIAPAEKYDEYGAISLGIQMYANSNIIPHENLTDIRTAISSWIVKKSGPDSDSNGFIKALLLILSEVRRMKKIKQEMKKSRDYSPVLRVKREEHNKMDAWCKR